MLQLFLLHANFLSQDVGHCTLKLIVAMIKKMEHCNVANFIQLFCHYCAVNKISHTFRKLIKYNTTFVVVVVVVVNIISNH